MQDETKLLNCFFVCVKYRSMLCFPYLLYKIITHFSVVFQTSCFDVQLFLKQQTLKVIILVTIDNNLYGSWIFKLCHIGDINMHIYLTKKKREKKKERKNPKDRTKYVALQITATPRWKHSCVSVIRCLDNLSFIIFRWDFLRPFLRLRSTSLHLVFFSVRLKRN